MIQFYAPDIASTLTLPESDSRHAVKVLRMTEGDTLQAIDGCGLLYTCRLVEAHPKRAAVEIIESRLQPLPWAQQLTVAVAPTKHMDRMEWMVEKLVEIGVNRIVPLLCRHSERKELKPERLRKIAVSAMKQSLKSALPTIEEMTPIKTFLNEPSGGTDRYIAYCDRNIERRLLAKTYRPLRDSTILIGPEGDFSPEEVSAALSAGYIPVSLGDCRLRTETAAVSACDTCHIINQLNS